jgi:hypothetical protein
MWMLKERKRGGKEGSYNSLIELDGHLGGADRHSACLLSIDTRRRKRCKISMFECCTCIIRTFITGSPMRAGPGLGRWVG